MAQADPRLRKLKIQTGVVKRITKEKAMYEKEALQLEQKIEKQKAEGADEYVIKKQLEVLQESKGMGPDTKKRLTTAFADLENVMQEAEGDLGDSQEFEDAKKVLEDAKVALA